MVEIVKLILAWANESQGNGFTLFVITVLTLSLTYYIISQFLDTIKAFAPKKGK